MTSLVHCDLYIGNRAEDYQLPYYQYVSHDPSMEDMRKVVCVENMRPPILSWWKNDEVSIINLSWVSM